MNPKQQGMTLVELMVTLAVVAILFSAAVPSLVSLAENNRLTALNNQVVSAINFTRSEAVKRRYNTAMCVRNNAGTGCAGSGTFDNGWVVFVDCDNDGTVDPATSLICDTNGDGTGDSAEQVLQDTIPSADGLTISNNETSTPRRISYRPNGSLETKNATLTINKGPTNIYDVTIARTGRVSSCKYGATYGGC